MPSRTEAAEFTGIIGDETEGNWGFWEDVVLLGIGFFGTLAALMPIQAIGPTGIDALVGGGIGGVLVALRRTGSLEEITRDGGTSFFRATAVGFLAVFLTFVVLESTGLRTTLSQLVWGTGSLMAGIIGATATYRRF